MSCTPSPSRPAVERTLDVAAPADEIWSELVSGAWLGDDVEIDARPGGALRVDGKIGVVEEADPPRRLLFSWAARDGREPPSRVDVELMPLETGTRLRVRETRLEPSQTWFAQHPPPLLPMPAVRHTPVVSHPPVVPRPSSAPRPRALARA